MMYSFLIWLHLVGIACGGAATFGHPAVGLLRARHPSSGAVLGKVAEAPGTVGVAGLVLLVLSGAGLVWLAHDLGQMPVAFWVKMGLVVGLVANITAAKVSAARADAGDVAAEARMPLLTMTAAALMLLILAGAVISFA